MKFFYIFILVSFGFFQACSSPDTEENKISTETYSLSQSILRSDSSSLLIGQTTKVYLILRDKSAKLVLKKDLNVVFESTGSGDASFSAVQYDAETGFYYTTITAETLGYVFISAKIEDKPLESQAIAIALNEELSQAVIYPKTSYYDDGSSVIVDIAHTNQTAKIRYTIDGTNPSETTGLIYSAPFELTAPKTVKAIAYIENSNYDASDIVESELSSDISISVSEDLAKWNKSFDYGGDDRFRDAVIDSEGNIYVVGYGLTIIGSGYDWIIKKFDKNGVEDTINWNKSFDGGAGTGNHNDYAYGVAVDSQDNVYVVGVGRDLIGAGTDSDWWIKKFDKNGVEDTVNWDKKIDGNTNDDYAFDVAVDKDDNIYVVGYGINIVGGASNRDVWIKKFSSDGTEDTVNWDKKINFRNREDWAIRVKIDKKNKLYIIGSGNNAFGTATGYDWWIKKYTLDGQEDTTHWDKKINIGTTDYVQNIDFDSQNNVYIVGIAYGINTGYACVIKKFDEDGEEDTTHWNKVFNIKNYAGNNDDSRLSDIKINKNDIVYIGGAGYRGVSASSYWDWFFTKYDKNGIEDTNNFNIKIHVSGQDYLHKILINSEENLFLIGGVAGNHYNAMIKKILIEKVN